MSKAHCVEVQRGRRFKFGANWRRFLRTLDDDRIAEAENSLKRMLGVDSLYGKRFLDIGSGSGLFSLAARRLGASVHSFDFDPDSVACTEELKRRYFDDDATWTIDEASALDGQYLSSLGKFDVVYSWGVLHHTGDMQSALENAAIPVVEGGLLFVAIYNDQDAVSQMWKVVKRAYCSGPVGRFAVLASFVPWFAAREIVVGLVRYRRSMGAFSEYKTRRGMAPIHDWVDWLGGYPFEVARPERILRVYRKAGFELVELKTTNRLGCNEFVFRRSRSSSQTSILAGSR